MKRREFVLKSSLLTTIILAPMSISSCTLNSSNQMNRIGIVGQGYVGTAVRTVFEKHYDTYT